MNMAIFCVERCVTWNRIILTLSPGLLNSLEASARTWWSRDHLFGVLWLSCCQWLWWQHTQSLVGHHRQGTLLKQYWFHVYVINKYHWYPFWVSVVLFFSAYGPWWVTQEGYGLPRWRTTSSSAAQQTELSRCGMQTQASVLIHCTDTPLQSGVCTSTKTCKSMTVTPATNASQDSDYLNEI